MMYKSTIVHLGKTRTFRTIQGMSHTGFVAKARIILSVMGAAADKFLK